MNKNIYSLLFFFALLFGGVSVTSAQNELSVATFEDLGLEPGSYWFYNPEQPVGSFKSGSFTFNNSWSEWDGFIYWEAFAYSSMALGLDDLSDYDAQYGNVTGKGVDGSNTFAVVFYSLYSPPVIRLDNPAVISGVYLTNDLYTYNSVINGDYFAGDPFEQGDYLKVIFEEATIANGTKNVRPMVEFYLADYRSENPADHYIVTDWEWLDLSELGEVPAITLYFEGSRNNEYGLLTPAYLCMDNFGSDGSTNLPTIKEESQSQVSVSDEQLIIQSALSNYRVSVYAANGSLMYKGIAQGDSNINIASWARGVYVVEISSPEGKEVKKIVK